jgi:hypothetical protein
VLYARRKESALLALKAGERGILYLFNSSGGVKELKSCGCGQPPRRLSENRYFFSDQGICRKSSTVI